MVILNFEKKHVQEAREIAFENYYEERQSVKELPQVCDIPDLSEFAGNGLGVAAFENQKMTGFLCCYEPFDNAFGSTDVRGIFSHMGANAAVTENRAKIYAAMYQAAGAKWIKAGAVSHAVCLYSNSWYSYAWMTARRLDAQIHDIAQGGIALLDGTGWFCEPEAVGMETAWDKIHYNPAFGTSMQWDFSQYAPQVVIVAIGQNDSHPEDYMGLDYDGEKAMKWRAHYRRFLEKLRETYPDAHIVCCTTLLCHDPSWDKAIGEVVELLKDEKITQCLFRRNGNGTPGHLRIPEAEEMAEELSAYINGLSL